MSILVVAEQKDGSLNRASWEAIAAAQQIGGPLQIASRRACCSGVCAQKVTATVLNGNA